LEPGQKYKAKTVYSFENGALKEVTACWI
jgi:hypothetical protein